MGKRVIGLGGAGNAAVHGAVVGDGEVWAGRLARIQSETREWE